MVDFLGYSVSVKILELILHFSIWHLCLLMVITQYWICNRPRLLWVQAKELSDWVIWNFVFKWTDNTDKNVCTDKAHYSHDKSCQTGSSRILCPSDLMTDKYVCTDKAHYSHDEARCLVPYCAAPFTTITKVNSGFNSISVFWNMPFFLSGEWGVEERSYL